MCSDQHTLGNCLWQPRYIHLTSPRTLQVTFYTEVLLHHSDDLSVSNGTRKDLLLFDTTYQLSLSQFGPVRTAFMLHTYLSVLNVNVSHFYVQPEIHGLTNYYLLVYRNKTSVVSS